MGHSFNTENGADVVNVYGNSYTLLESLSGMMPKALLMGLSSGPKMYITFTR
jgi:hypothetical protein